MKPPMRHTAYKVATTRNAYGDYIAGAKTAIICHFREITDLVTSTSNEAINCDAMAWFEADSGIIKGDILIIESQGYKVEKLIKARRLHSVEVQFIKTELTKYGVIS